MKSHASPRLRLHAALAAVAVVWRRRFALLACLALACAAHAQQTPSSVNDLDALLSDIHFDSAHDPGNLGARLVALPETDLQQLCQRLVEAGTGDDTAVRMALHGAALYAASGAQPADREKVVRCLCAALDESRPQEVSQFLIEQVRLVGDVAAVPTLARLLKNAELCPAAVGALATIGGDEACTALRAAYEPTADRCRVAIIDALGVMRDRAAVELMARDTKSADESIRAAAIAALANLGASEPLQAALQANPPKDEHAAAQQAALMLRAADRLAAAKEPDNAVQIYKELLHASAVFAQPQVRSAALYGLAHAQGAEAVAEIVQAVVGDDAELRAAALEVGATLPGDAVTAAFVTQLEHSPPPTQCSILALLARRGDQAAFPAALRALRDNSQDVRIAAVSTVTAVGGEDAVRPLVNYLGRDDRTEQQAACDALASLVGDAISARIAENLARSGPGVTARLLEVLQRRAARDQLDLIWPFVEDGNEEVRIAAAQAIGALADESAARRLIGRLSRSDVQRERYTLERALGDVCARAATSPARTAEISAYLDQVELRDRCVLLRVLGRLGGTEALDTLRAALRDEQVEVREAAVRGLADWPDCTAAELALESAQSASDLKLHVLALRAYVRMLLLEPRQPIDQIVAAFAAGMGAAERVEEKRLILAGVAALTDPRALDYLAPYLRDGELRDEAASAMLNVANALLPGGWAPARSAVVAVIDSVQNEELLARADELLSQIGQYEDYLTAWQVAGPFNAAGRSGRELLDVPFPPEEPDASAYSWKAQPMADGGDDFWLVNLNRSAASDNAAAYLRTFVWSRQVQPIRVELGSDDGLKVWLNGEVIHSNNALRGCVPKQDLVAATLKSGWNCLLLKVTNVGGGFAAVARLRAPDGGHVNGLKIQARPPDEHAQTPPSRDGWRELFNGVDLKGWTCKEGAWKVEDGALTRAAGGSYLWTEEQFGDFVLEAEFKLAAGANSGIFFRTGDVNDPVQTGIEMQVYDTYGKSEPGKNDCGAIYDCVAPSSNPLKPAGEWNHVVIECRGSRIQVEMNGVGIIDMDLDAWTQPHQNPDGTPNKFNTAMRDMPRRGYIGFQDHGDVVWYRNVRIKPL